MNRADAFARCSLSELDRQAPMAVKGYLLAAVSAINDAFPTFDDDAPDYAERHPELVAAFVAACAQEYAASTALQGRGFLAEVVEEAIYQTGLNILAAARLATK